MTTADEADAPNPEPPTAAVADTAIPDSPGRQLRQARESRKLDISHVATALRLTPQVVDAIERDDYAPLPSATFVSGYIRGYARLVGLDPDPLNQSFRRLHPDAEPPPRHVTRGDHQGAPGEAGGIGGYLILLLLVLAVAAGGYAWWVMRPGPDEPARTASAPEPSAPRPSSMGAPRRDLAPEPAPPPGTDADPLSSRDRARSSLDEPPARAGDTGSEADPETGPETGSGAGSEPILGTSPDVRIAEPEAEPPAVAADSLPAVIDSPDADRPLPSPPSPADERPAPRPTTTPADEEETAAATAATARPVELRFTGPCWVDIRDATGDVLVFGEMSRGDRESLAGEPPYSLVIGNAAAVELTVDGAPYDLGSIARGNVARFELDPAEISAQTPNTPPATPPNTPPNTPPDTTTDATPGTTD